MDKLNIAYLRVSTDGQGQDEKDQRPDIESIIRDKAGVEWVYERGSAWKDDLKNRPEFARILERIKNHEVSALYIWDIDRLFRKKLKIKEVFELCKAHGCTIFSYRQQFLNVLDNMQLPDGFGWLRDIQKQTFIEMLAYIAEEESQKKSDRIRKAFLSGKHKDWGRPQVKFNERRAYHLLFNETPVWSLDKVAKELGVSKGTIFRFKKVCEENPPSFIKEIESH